MRKITIVLLSSLLIIALGACKNATPQVENGKPALMWFDAEANFERFSNPDSIDYYLTKIKSLGFTHAIVDVRPITGEVLFDTEFAPKMREWHGYERKDFDYLGHFIKKAHELGIEVHASLNVFVAGHNYFEQDEERVGYFIQSEEGELIEFYLSDELLSRKEEIFGNG